MKVIMQVSVIVVSIVFVFMGNLLMSIDSKSVNLKGSIKPQQQQPFVVKSKKNDKKRDKKTDKI